MLLMDCFWVWLHCIWCIAASLLSYGYMRLNMLVAYVGQYFVSGLLTLSVLDHEWTLCRLCFFYVSCLGSLFAPFYVSTGALGFDHWVEDMFGSLLVLFSELSMKALPFSCICNERWTVFFLIYNQKQRFFSR